MSEQQGIERHRVQEQLEGFGKVLGLDPRLAGALVVLFFLMALIIRPPLHIAAITLVGSFFGLRWLEEHVSTESIEAAVYYFLSQPVAFDASEANDDYEPIQE